MNKLIAALLAILVMAFSPMLRAQGTPLPAASEAEPSEAEMLTRLRALYPKSAFVQVTKATLPGIYEVVVGKNVVYVESSGRYWLFGHVWDMRAQEDLTEGKLAAVSKIDVRALPLADAVKTVKGDGRRTLIVFSDPDCPYCKQLERSLSALTDVTIYTFLYPLDSIHPQARAKAIAVWCSADRAKAWATVMAGGALPEAKPCSDPIDRNIKLATQYQVRGTPTLISSDGRQLPGAPTPDKLTAWLDAAQKPEKVAQGGSQ